MHETKVWDIGLRLFHWSFAALFLINATLTDGDGAAHAWIGYGIAGLLAARLVWGLAGPRHARFTSFPPSLSAAAGHLTDIATRRTRFHKGHSPLGALMVYNLLGTVALICLTGWLMTLDPFWGRTWPEEAHEVLVTWAEISVVVHIGAVLFETRRTGVKLFRAMLTGYKNVP